MLPIVAAAAFTAVGSAAVQDWKPNFTSCFIGHISALLQLTNRILTTTILEEF